MIGKVREIIRKRGLKGVFASCIYNGSCFLFKLLPINQRLIVMESDGDLCDNSFALYQYLKDSGYLKKYKIAWLVYDIEGGRRKLNSDVIFLNKNFDKGIIKRVFYLRTCKWYIYDHINYLEGKKRGGQAVVYLTHGCGLKAINPKEGFKADIDRCYVTGKFSISFVARSQACPEEVVKDLGYPRMDCFFKPISERQKEFKKHFNFSAYQRVFLWMPTFRKSNKEGLSEEYFNSRTGLPLLESEDALRAFDEFLREKNCLCLLKIHHLQAELPAFQCKLSNILILNDEKIAEEGLQLYEVVRLTDVLITDYSSISNDYLLLDQPIIYTLDDYEEYKASRGFMIDDPIRYYVGHHAYTPRELEEAVADILENGDSFREERNKTLSELHTYCDGNAAARIVQDLGL